MFIGSIVSMGLGIGDIIDLGEENIYLDEQSSGTFTIQFPTADASNAILRIA